MRARLVLEDVEPRAGDAALGERLVQRRLVDDRSARRVDEVGGRLHERETRLVEKAARLLGERDVHGHDVGAGEELVEPDLGHPG